MATEVLRAGASVVSADGHKLGTLSHFVVNRTTQKLTHIVVDTGLLRSGEPLWKGGWGLSHDRVIPVGAIERAAGDIALTMTADEFKDLSVKYAQEQFEAMPDVEPGRIDASDLARLGASLPGEPGPYFLRETQAHAADEVDIEKDSPVWRLRPHQKIGEVERLIVDDATNTVSALVIRRGLVFSKDVVLPMQFVVEVVADIVRVDIGDGDLKELSEFHAKD
jgi:sporulation protein YlmC with PRC-barrel domain